MKEFKDMTMDIVLGIMKDADKAYARVIREYGTLKDKAKARNKVKEHIDNIKKNAYQEIKEYLDDNRTILYDSTKRNSGSNDIAAEMQRNNELILMKSLIDGTDKAELVDLVNKYVESEYFDDFKTMIKPKIKELLEDQTTERIKNAEIVDNMMAAMEQVPKAIAAEIAYLDEVEEGVRSLLYFNDRTFNINIRATEDGRILHGNCETRNIDYDISTANENFNPLGEKNLKPLVKTESFGTTFFKSLDYEYEWGDIEV